MRFPKTPEDHANYYMLRLMNTVKWALYSLIYIVYLFTVGVVFVNGDWKSGMLALFAIIAIHPLRYLWDDANKAKFDLTNHPDYDAEKSSMVLSFQKRLVFVLSSVVYLCDIGFIVLTYFAVDQMWAAAVLGGLIAVELLHMRIRKMNKDLRTAERQEEVRIDREYEEQERKAREADAKIPPTTPEKDLEKDDGQ